MRAAMMPEKLDTVVLIKAEGGYEMCDTDGQVLALYLSWEPVAEILRQARYSAEYIANRKIKADARYETLAAVR